MTQCRTGKNRLQESLGRVTKEDRTCKLCRKETEGVEHFICRCPCYKWERMEFSQVLGDLTLAEQHPHHEGEVGIEKGGDEGRRVAGLPEADRGGGLFTLLVAIPISSSHDTSPNKRKWTRKKPQAGRTHEGRSPVSGFAAMWMGMAVPSLGERIRI